MTLYPIGYGTRLVTMAELRATHEPKMHPEFARRLFAWLETTRGAIGIGGGWRDTQPDRPGFAPDGKSFHQFQTFASGLVAYCAVDLVKRSSARHVAPDWADTESAPGYGLHTFITGEPWHMQPVEIRGWQTWVNAGRPDPTPPTRPDPPKGDSVFTKLIRLEGTLAVYACYSGGYKVWVRNPSEQAAFESLGAAPPEVIPTALRHLFAITGPILGDRPPGVDSMGLPL